MSVQEIVCKCKKELNLKIAPITVYKWLQHPERILNTHGRPCITSPERVLEKLDALPADVRRSATTVKEFPEVVRECAKEEFLARGLNRRDCEFEHRIRMRPISRSTLLNIRKRAKITVVNARLFPHSRDQHCRSARDAVAEALALYALLHFYPENLEWTVHPSNFQSLDPVTVAVDGQAKRKVIRTPKHRSARLAPIVVAKKGQPFQIKCLVVMRADGTIPDPFIAIMQCDEVPDGVIVPIRLPKFSPNPDGIGEIWLVHTTHGDNLRLVNQWLFTTVIIPSFEATLKKTSNLMARSKDVKEVGLFQCDGEMEQLAVFTDPKVIQAFRDYHINGMKHSAGTSLLFQANDVGHCHSSLHTFVNEQTYAHLLMPSDVEEAKACIEQAQSLLRSEGCVPLSTTTVTKLIRAFTCIQPALSQAFDKPKILSSFRKCGLWNGVDCDVETLLFRSDAFKNMSTGDFKTLLERILERCKNPRTGMCEESELDELGIPMTDEERERRESKTKVQLNAMSETRQRAFIFTGQGYEEWKHGRASTAVEINEMKQKKKEATERKKEENEEKKCITNLKKAAKADKIRALLESPNDPTDASVKCSFHGHISRSKWIQRGLGNWGWKRCPKCLCHFCPLCSKKVLKESGETLKRETFRQKNTRTPASRHSLSQRQTCCHSLSQRQASWPSLNQRQLKNEQSLSSSSPRPRKKPSTIGVDVTNATSGGCSHLAENGTNLNLCVQT